MPTTGVPGTAAPTTGTPTTGMPSTGVPKTATPVTGEPTTGAPTTGSPSTGSPTTGAPDTGVPTTGSPTTGSPMSGAPTTGTPTTGVPTTGEPSTGTPGTTPDTGTPTTGSPTTGLPSTGQPTTGVPTSGSPTTGVPVTGNPVTGAPSTGAPTTGSPMTGVPTTGAPTTAEPTTGEPTTGSPATGAPATAEPTTGAPSTGAPTTGGPMSGSPTTGLPTTGMPSTGAPTTGVPSTGVPTTGVPNPFVPPVPTQLTPPPTPVTLPPTTDPGVTLADIEWCSSDSHCRQDGDPFAQCINATKRCSCSAGFGPATVGGVTEYYCYAVGLTVAPKLHSVILELLWPLGNCLQYESQALGDDLVAAVQNTTQSQVLSYTQSCGSLYVAVELAMRSNEVDAKLRNAGQMVTSRVRSDPALSQVLVGDLITEAIILPEVGITCSMQHAKKTIVFERPGQVPVCSALECNAGYAKQRGLSGEHVCVVSVPTVRQPCVVQADCDAGAGRRCVAGYCTIATFTPSAYLFTDAPGMARALTNDDDDDTEKNLSIILPCIIGAVLCVALVAAVVMWPKKKAKEEAREAEPTAGDRGHTEYYDSPPHSRSHDAPRGVPSGSAYPTEGDPRDDPLEVMSDADGDKYIDRIV
eukprot:TRINITY_DN1434_c0_g1_i4.p1 TRINITY_DN1434_c0_g1~~TRINITY_DN1434_c0_g1_i4.p1  ORF type:complete len:705 (+),score=63.81 TRINITY_DN1434_c0_g1_i4:209-2116(+)